MQGPPNPTESWSFEVPNPFGRYKILRKLGQGGMGTVYLAEDTILHRQVALKVPRGLAGEGPEVVARFHREAQVLAGFSHPNICRIHDIGEIDGYHYLTMEYHEGRTLDAVLAPGKPMRPEQAVKIVRKLALALRKAHERGIVHRDLKPSNVLLTARKDLVLLDFGLARQVDSARSLLTQTGQTLGTPSYMAPEQVNADAARIGPWSDVYSLGVMLYEMLCGRRPFNGPVTLIFAMIVNDPPEPPSKFRPGLDPALEAVCLKALRKEPADRYASMAEFAEALGNWLAGSNVPDAPTGEILVGATADAGRSSPARPGGWTRPARWLVAAASALAIVLAIVFYMATDTGTVRLEVHDPAAVAVVKIDGQVVRLEGRETPITLRAGPHEITVEHHARTTETQKFTLTRGAVEVVRLAVEPKKEASAGAAAIETPRKAAKSTPARFVNSLGMTLVRIEPGTFTMGSSQEQLDQLVKRFPNVNVSTFADERPARPARIARPFHLATHEVTVGQFRAFVEATGYRTDAETDGKGGIGWDKVSRSFKKDKQYSWRNPGFDQTDAHPVVNVSWNDATAFCDWLTKTDGSRRGLRYRLPTEAEWEYACRAGSTSLFTNGDDPEGLAAIGNVSDGSARGRYMLAGAIRADDGHADTAPVGSYLPNPFGLHDMIGNVGEWCEDAYSIEANLGPAVSGPSGPSSRPAMPRVIRGGSYRLAVWRCRPANRDSSSQENRRNSLGFRPAATELE